MAYAKNTSVPVDRSKSEIERILVRYGAESFAYASKADSVMIEFQMNGKRVRFVIPMPKTPPRDSTGVVQNKYAQSVRQKWRALALVIKAKLEAVDSDITTMEQEFLAHIVLPDGRTFGDEMIPRIDEVYKAGNVPALTWEG